MDEVAISNLMYYLQVTETTSFVFLELLNEGISIVLYADYVKTI